MASQALVEATLAKVFADVVLSARTSKGLKPMHTIRGVAVLLCEDKLPVLDLFDAQQHMIVLRNAVAKYDADGFVFLWDEPGRIVAVSVSRWLTSVALAYPYTASPFGCTFADSVKLPDVALTYTAVWPPPPETPTSSD